MSQEYGDYRISEYAIPIFHAMSLDGYTGKNQTVSLFVGLLAKRNELSPFMTLDVDSLKLKVRFPILLRLQLAKYSGDTGYSTA